MFFFDTCNAVAAREDQKPKYWRLGRSHLGLSLTLWPHNVKREILNMTCDCWFPSSCVYWSLVKARTIVWESQVIDSSSITQSEVLWVWRCDVKLNPRWRRPSRQYFGFRSSHAATALHVSKKNITFCFNQGYYFHMYYKRELLGCSSPLMKT